MGNFCYFIVKCLKQETCLVEKGYFSENWILRVIAFCEKPITFWPWNKLATLTKGRLYVRKLTKLSINILISKVNVPQEAPSYKNRYCFGALFLSGTFFYLTWITICKIHEYYERTMMTLVFMFFLQMIKMIEPFYAVVLKDL